MNRQQRRNASCPCGSGQSLKHCCKKTDPEKPIAVTVRQPRGTAIEFDFGKPVAINSYGVNFQGKELSFGRLKCDGEIVKPVFVRVVATMVRRNPSKPNAVLADIPCLNIPDDGEVSSNLHKVLRHFDFLFAIDTNTRLIFGHNISISSIYKAGPDVKDETVWWMCKEGNVWATWRDEAEKRGWLELIKKLHSHTSLGQKQIGIIVDHDLQNLKAYNLREKPILDDFFLPNNFHLLYATANAGTKEFFPNLMVEKCDKESSRLFNALKEWPENFRKMATNSL